VTKPEETTAVREDPPAGHQPTPTQGQPLLAYRRPIIEHLGDLRSVVLGASVGQPDTSNPNLGHNA
jgi:hypothetical protein